MPMRLDEGWNQVQFNLSDFTRRAYGKREKRRKEEGKEGGKTTNIAIGTNYLETLRVHVHANCRLRRIYFSDRYILLFSSLLFSLSSLLLLLVLCSFLFRIIRLSALIRMARLYSEEELPPEFKLLLPVTNKA